MLMCQFWSRLLILPNKISARKSLFFMSRFGSETPFMLLAKLKVKEDKVAEYLEIADKTDKAVEAVSYTHLTLPTKRIV